MSYTYTVNQILQESGPAIVETAEHMAQSDQAFERHEAVDLPRVRLKNEAIVSGGLVWDTARLAGLDGATLMR